MSSRPATRKSRLNLSRIGLHARSRPVRRRKKGVHGEHRLSPESRRTRALLVGAGIFALVVLVTSMPVSELLTQRSQISQTALQVRRVQAENSALKKETSELSDPSIVSDIARRDYGLVSPGSQAYEILPVPGSSTSAAQSSGHVPLDGPPVVPGSAQSQALLGAGALSPVTTGATPEGSAGGSGGGAGAGDDATHRGDELTPKGGFWTRVADTLAFWR